MKTWQHAMDIAEAFATPSTVEGRFDLGHARFWLAYAVEVRAREELGENGPLSDDYPPFAPLDVPDRTVACRNCGWSIERCQSQCATGWHHSIGRVPECEHVSGSFAEPFEPQPCFACGKVLDN